MIQGERVLNGGGREQGRTGNFRKGLTEMGLNSKEGNGA